MDTRNVIARFEAERQALAMMDHPNIAKVLDGGATETGRPYFVMELVRGIKITDFCDQNRLSTRERLDLFIQVCEAIQHAHQKGIIHRDLKPSNILVTLHDPGGPGVPMIIDFGIAKATHGRLTDQTLFTAFEQFLGTPAYMSPEQTLMTVLDVDTRSDIYSLGVLLYELLTGRTPFEAKELMASGLDEMRRTIREKEPPRPSTRLSTLLGAEQVNAAQFRQTEPPKLIHLLRGDLDWIVMRCLEKDRTRRYETAHALARDLQRHLNHEPVLARPPSRLYEFQKTVRRHKFGFGAAALVMISLFIGAAASLWQAARAGHAERQERLTAQQAQLRAYVADMNLAQQALREGDLGRARALLRSHVPGPAAPDLRNWEWRYLANECRGDEWFGLIGHSGAVNNIRFVDRNTLLTTGAQDQRRILWNLGEQKPLRTMRNEGPTGATGPLVLALKRRVAFYRSGPEDHPSVRSLQLATGVDAEFCKTSARGLALAISPNEDLLAVASGNQVELWDIAGKRTLPNPVRTPGPVNALAFSPDGRKLAVAGGDASGTFIVRDLATQTDTASAGASGWVCFYSPDGRWLVCGLGFAPVLTVRRAEDQTVVRNLQDTAPTSNGFFSPDGKWLATVGGDASVRLWNTDTWQIQFTLRGHTEPVICADFSPDSQLLATGARNGEVKVWKMAAPRPRSDGVVFTNSAVVGLVRDGSAFWRVTRSEQPTPSPANSVGAVRVTEGEAWSAAPMRRLGPLRLEDLVLGGASGDGAPGGLSLAVGAADNTIHFRSIGSTNDLAIVQAGGGTLESLQISPDGSTLVSLARDEHCMIRFWRLPRLELIAQHADIPNVLRICLSQDASTLAIFTTSGEVRVLDVASWIEPPAWKAVEGVPDWMACAFSSDHRQLAAAARAGDLYLWNLSSRHQDALLRSLTSYTSLSFSPDGTRLLASDDKAIRLFDTANGQLVWSINEPGFQVAFTRDGQGILGVGSQRAFVLYGPSLEQLRFDWLIGQDRDARAGAPSRPLRESHQ